MLNFILNKFRKIKTNGDGHLLTAIGVAPYLYHLSTKKDLTMIPLDSDYGNIAWMADTLHGYVITLGPPTYENKYNDPFMVSELEQARVNKTTYNFYAYRVDSSKLTLSKAHIVEHDDGSKFMWDRHLSGAVVSEIPIPAEYMGVVTINMLTKQQHMTYPYTRVVTVLGLSNPELLHSSMPYMAYELHTSEDGDVLSNDILVRDRQRCYLHYHKYKGILARNVDNHVKTLQKYFKTHTIG